KAPLEPGVYLMKNSNGRIIYVGKAKSLKKRLKQYVNGGRVERKVKAMMGHVRDIEYIITDSEVEALVLELNFIKEEKPPYNIMLRDDKSYPYIKVTLDEEYPRVIKTRNVKKDGARYFGPYPNTGYVNLMVNLINDSFPIKKCAKKLGKEGQRPCLNYHINRCMGPCRKNADTDGYKDLIKSIIAIIEGRSEELLKELKSKMAEHAENMEFEKAAKKRDQIKAVDYIHENQKVIFEKPLDQDYIAMARKEEKVSFMIFYIREGRLVGKDNYIIEDLLETDGGEIIMMFISQYYSGSSYIPKEIVAKELPYDKELLEKWLSDKRGGKTSFLCPKRGDKAKLLKMAEKNAIEILEKQAEKEKEKAVKRKLVADKLKKALKMEGKIERIESYDISNISGVYSVGSMVVFEDSEPAKRAYRRFRIRTVDQADDYKSMQEILYRRFKNGLDEKDAIEKGDLRLGGKFSDFPDLILIDGGLGHVHAVADVIEAFGLDIPVIGMKKDSKHRTESLVYKEKTIEIKQDRELLKFISRIQDETHRFAIEYHKKLRGQALSKSVLDDIKGVGEKRKNALFKAFGTIDAIKEADAETLSKLKEIDRRTAEAIVDYFNK
ncbi:MAG: excinuclease ABC subunit C, partial [Clostridiales bacterium]